MAAPQIQSFLAGLILSLALWALFAGVVMIPPIDGQKNFTPPLWVPDFLVNEGVRIAADEVMAPAIIDHSEEEEPIAD